MHADRKAEGRGQACSDIIPTAPAIRRPPDPVMVLLVEHVIGPRRAHHAMHAVTCFTVARCGRMVVMGTGPGIGQTVQAQYPSLPPPAQYVPVTGSPTAWLIGQPSQNGPETCQS